MKYSSNYLAFMRKACFLYMLLLGSLLCANTLGYAQEMERPNYAYIAVEPDIVTNYVTDNAGKLGYIKVTLEIMLDQPELIPNVEHHMPLLRATAIEVYGAQSENKIRSLTGREEIRREILRRFKDLLLRETGEETVRDIIVTRYLRQGG